MNFGATSGKMQWILLFLFVGFLSSAAMSQQRYRIEKGEISFTSDAELELIKASSNSVQGLLDPESNQFAFTIDIQSFKGFNSDLQREHFNEKYLESDRFPKARFSGKIIEQIDFSRNDTYEVRAKGELDIHGEKQTRIIKGKITTQDGRVRIEASFMVPLADHNITVPSIVKQKIATEIEVVLLATMATQ
jgi:polyisoprenoid-binding protein YceI